MAALLRRLGSTAWLCASLLVHQQQTSIAAPPKLLIFTFAESVVTCLARSPPRAGPDTAARLRPALTLTARAAARAATTAGTT